MYVLSMPVHLRTVLKLTRLDLMDGVMEGDESEAVPRESSDGLHCCCVTLAAVVLLDCTGHVSIENT